MAKGTKGTKGTPAPKNAGPSPEEATLAQRFRALVASIIEADGMVANAEASATEVRKQTALAVLQGAVTLLGVHADKALGKARRVFAAEVASVMLEADAKRTRQSVFKHLTSAFDAAKPEEQASYIAAGYKPPTPKAERATRERSQAEWIERAQEGLNHLLGQELEAENADAWGALVKVTARFIRWAAEVTPDKDTAQFLERASKTA